MIEIEQELRRLNWLVDDMLEALNALHDRNAELKAALQGLADEVERFGLHHPDGNSNWWPVSLEKAKATLAEEGETT